MISTSISVVVVVSMRFVFWVRRCSVIVIPNTPWSFCVAMLSTLKTVWVRKCGVFWYIADGLVPEAVVVLSAFFFAEHFATIGCSVLQGNGSANLVKFSSGFADTSEFRFLCVVVVVVVVVIMDFQPAVTVVSPAASWLITANEECGAEKHKY